MNQPERELVLKPCLDWLKKQIFTGAILQYRRLDALDRFHINGSPDIEIWIPKDKTIWILMAECKRPDGGSLSPAQVSYRNKYKDFKNVIYVDIRSLKELQDLVFKMSDYDSVDEFNRFNGETL